MPALQEHGTEFSNEELLYLCAQYLVSTDINECVKLWSGMHGNEEKSRVMIDMMISVFEKNGHFVQRLSGGGVIVRKGGKNGA